MKAIYTCVSDWFAFSVKFFQYFFCGLDNSKTKVITSHDNIENNKTTSLALYLSAKNAQKGPLIDWIIGLIPASIPAELALTPICLESNAVYGKEETNPAKSKKKNPL